MNNDEAIIQLHCMRVNIITTTKKNKSWCQTNFPRFWLKEFWHPFSPDLNPMNFNIWSILEKTCASSHLNVEALKRSLEKEWEKISQSAICAAIKSFRGRLKKIIKAKGGSHRAINT